MRDLVGFVVIFYAISAIIFYVYIYFVCHYIFVKYFKDLNEIGIDKILVLNPFFFPIQRVRNIFEAKGNTKILKMISIIKFYKFYAIIGVAVFFFGLAFITNS